MTKPEMRLEQIIGLCQGLKGTIQADLCNENTILLPEKVLKRQQIAKEIKTQAVWLIKELEDLKIYKFGGEK